MARALLPLLVLALAAPAQAAVELHGFESLGRAASVHPGVERSHVVMSGSLGEGGPAVETRLGDLELDWSELVGKLGERRGVSVGGLALGPVTARSFYAVDGEERAFGAQAEAALGGGISVGGTMVHHEGGTEAALEAAVELGPGIGLDGQAAVDSGEGSLYRVRTKVTALPNLTVEAGYRDNDGFTPRYGDSRRYDGHTGLDFRVATRQAGVGLVAAYDAPTRTADATARTALLGVRLVASARAVAEELEELRLALDRAFPLAGARLTGGYGGRFRPGLPGEHTLRAALPVGGWLEALDGLRLSGEMRLAGAVAVGWKAGATYAGPQGLELEAAYEDGRGFSLAVEVDARF